MSDTHSLSSDRVVQPWPAEPQRANAGRYGNVQWMYAEYVGEYDYIGRKYEMDRATAAIDRLVIAVKALEAIRSDAAVAGYDAGHAGIHCKALDALTAIGALPNE